MARKGLSKERLVEEAAALMEESGLDGFSMRALAQRLEVKPASLYNHVESMEALMTEVCAYAMKCQRDAQMEAIRGKTGTQAIFALAQACRGFAREHRALYWLIMTTAASQGERLGERANNLVAPFLQVLENSGLTEAEKIHWQRVLRALIHGFVAQEEAGFFSHMPASGEESFRIAIACYAQGLAQAERRENYGNTN